MSEYDWDVFIAHAGPDLGAAEQLHGLLKESCRVFLDSQNLRLGEPWDDALVSAQKSAQYSVCLISSSTDKAYYLREEIAQAIELSRQAAGQHRVVPIYLDGAPGEVSDVPYGLRRLHGIRLGGDTTLRTVADRLLTELLPSAKALVPGDSHSEIATGFWNVPYQRNQFFIGRDDLLNSLAESTTSTTAVTAINGMGGVGKTELAVEYAHQRRNQVDVVWWIRAESRTQLVSDYVQLAEEVDVTPDPESQEETARSVIRWLNTTGRSWLVILDNAVNPAAVADWIPHSEQGQTVLTSRHPTWGETATPLDVGVFDPDIAVQYLLRRTSRDDRSGASRLAEGLGYLALALNQAGGYLNKVKRVSFDDYLAQLEADGLYEIPADGSRADHTVATLWSESFKALETATPVAAELLQLAALCSPDAIPLELFEQPITVQGEDNDPGPVGWSASEIDRAIAELSDYGLADQGLEPIISVHRLIQLAARTTLNQTTRIERLATLYQLLDQRFPDEPEIPTTWPECARYVAHLEHATSTDILGRTLTTSL